MTDTLTLTDIEDLATYALAEYNLDSEGWAFKWDRAVRRAGLCRFKTRTISLSKPVFAVEANRDQALNTILHEVAHALAGPQAGHGPTWKHVARSIGCTGDRCATLQAQPDLPIKGTCACKRDEPHQMARMPRRSYRCTVCMTMVTWERVR